MPIKKIAFFVEGQTEQIFINKLLIEIAGQKKIAIKLFKIRGGRSSPTQETPIPQLHPSPKNPKYEALIYDSGNDDKVKSDILENVDNLSKNGYSEVIGLRDLYPESTSELARLERGLAFTPPKYKPLPIPYEIIIAIPEVESWFLAEFEHFSCIDPKLTMAFIKAETGVNPSFDDMTILPHPSDSLKEIYMLVGKSYNKKKKNAERTVNCLDYANIYLSIQHKIHKLQLLISKIDTFLS